MLEGQIYGRAPEKLDEGTQNKIRELEQEAGRLQDEARRLSGRSMLYCGEPELTILRCQKDIHPDLWEEQQRSKGAPV